jgi:outer membrane protein OmpA-like peptidoglycan-associated protein
MWGFSKLTRRTAPAALPRLESDARTTAATMVRNETVPPSAESSGAPLAERIDEMPAGQPLPSEERFFFESRFRQDFSAVRVHSDAQAAEAAEQMGARAFAIGPDLVFGPGQYAPQTMAGLELIGHELTHTIQQAESGQAAVQMDPKGGKEGIGNAPPSEQVISFDTEGAEDGFVLFPSGSADVTSTMEKKMDGIIAGATEPVSIHIHGYASQEGDPTYNYNLSAHRGVNAKHYLESRLPPGSQVVVFAHGAHKGFGDLSSNRRVGVSMMGPVQKFGYKPKVTLGEGQGLKPPTSPFTGGGDKPSIFPKTVPGDPNQPNLVPKLPPVSDLSRIDWTKMQGALGGRGGGLRDYPGLGDSWQRVYQNYRDLGFSEDQAAWLANQAVSKALEAEAKRNNPNAIDRANDEWKGAHPNDMGGTIQSPNLLELFAPKKKKN